MVECTPTSSGDKPNSPCVIDACGQLQPDDPSLTRVGDSGDRYEEYPGDEENFDISQPRIALEVNRVLCC